MKKWLSTCENKIKNIAGDALTYNQENICKSPSKIATKGCI